MSVKNYLKNNYFSLPDMKSAKDAFSKNISKEGLKANIKYALYGGGLVGLERVSDWYANSPNAREWVFNNAPDFFNNYLSMHALQDTAVNSLGWAPGAFTDHVAMAGAAISAVSLGYLAVKKHLRNKEKKARKASPAGFDDTVGKFTPADVVDVIKNNPISTVMTGAGIVGHAANLLGYISAAVGSVYKTAEDAGTTATKKSKSQFSGIMGKLNDFYYNADIL